MPPVLDDAICIRQWDWSETSQTVSLMTEHLGLIRGLAKGSRRPKSPYSGGIELLTRGSVGIITKQDSDLSLVTELDLTETFPSLRRRLDAHNTAMYMADVLHHVVSDHDPHTGLYHALLEGLRGLAHARDQATSLLRFQWLTLSETGYEPVLDTAGTGASHPFSPSEGRFLTGANERMHSWRVRSTTIDVLRTLKGGERPADQDAIGRANRLLAAYLRFIIGREPKTMPLVFGRNLPK